MAKILRKLIDARLYPLEQFRHRWRFTVFEDVCLARDADVRDLRDDV